MSAAWRVAVLPALLLGLALVPGCGGKEQAEEAGRARFAAARAQYEKDFGNLGGDGTAAGDTTGGEPEASSGTGAVPLSPSGSDGAPTSHPGGGVTGAAGEPGPIAMSPSGQPAGTAVAGAPGPGLPATAVPPGAPTPRQFAGAGASTGEPAATAASATRTGPGSSAGSVSPGSASAGLASARGIGAAGGDPDALAPEAAATDPGAGDAVATPPSTGAAAGPSPRPGATPSRTPLPPEAEPSPSPTATPTPAEPADSDSKPPVPSSISFDPPTTPDNNRVKLSVVASDDRAGPERATGAIVGPSGHNKIYFSLTLDGTGAVLVGTIKVPPEAEAGAWVIQSISITDKAHNTGTYTPVDDPVVQAARLTVASQSSDTEPPTLDSINITPPEVSDQSPVKILVRGSDTRSTLQTVRGTLSSPTGAVKLPWSSYLNRNTGLFEGAANIPPHAEAGEWFISQILLIDAAKNRLTIDAPDPRLDAAKLKVKSTSDTEAPTLRSLAFSPASVHPPGLAALDIVAGDNMAGVKSASGLIQMAASQSPLAFTGQRYAPGQFRAQITVPNPAPLGTWRVLTLTLTDYAGNKVELPASDPMVAAAVLQVE